MNTARKGTALELKAKKILEADGYIVHRTIRSQFHHNDVFGCFDLVAKNDLGYTKWIQVTTLSQVSKKRKNIDTALDEGHFSVQEEVEVWGWVGRPDCHFRLWIRFRGNVWLEGLPRQ